MTTYEAKRLDSGCYTIKRTIGDDVAYLSQGITAGPVLLTRLFADALVAELTEEGETSGALLHYEEFLPLPAKDVRPYSPALPPA